jgi:ubiquinone/menaquinone biosynthesis C-methylase UbiE
MKSFDWTEHIRALDASPTLTERWEKELVAEFRRYLSRFSNPAVLEIGCSNGKWLNWFEKSFGARIFGVDNNPVGGDSVSNFTCADARDLPYADGTFDIVYSLGLVEHFSSKEERARLIREHVRVARPDGGMVAIFHPNMNLSLDRLYVKFYYDHKQGFKHFNIRHNETLSDLRENGVKILCTRWIGWIVPSIVGLLEGKARLMLHVKKQTRERFKRKLFESRLTAESFLVIGKRMG